jgi:hypothetical protein
MLGRIVHSTVEASEAFSAAAFAAEASAVTLLRAFAKASADWKRCAGSFAMDIRMISFNAGGSPGCSSIGGFGSSLT